MKNRWLGMAYVLPLLIACNSESSAIKVFCETVSKKQIDSPHYSNLMTTRK
ncbi:hypothetical protein [Vibrio campbellii]|uniref:Lipoprotein n=1 Tax=Vibrio campbellii TaxID=680 RepID=A0ABY5IF26_9VIBR|nr:hypothetical protein [Vibrio campbellii]UTZ23308.1 hypothetical protein HB760_17385 [Vibrio campbellii]UTZ32887.1 hypothetical protein HB762_24065 [Vibrio campbellii]